MGLGWHPSDADRGMYSCSETGRLVKRKTNDEIFFWISRETIRRKELVRARAVIGRPNNKRNLIRVITILCICCTRFARPRNFFFLASLA